MQLHRSFPGLLSVISLSVVLVCAAAMTADFDLRWITFDGGGGTSGASIYELTGTIGQPDAGGLMTGRDPGSGIEFTLAGGFWAAPIGLGSCPADIAPPGGDGLVNIDDLLEVITAWGVCPAAPAPCAADIAPASGDNHVNIDDLLAVINAWGMCP